MECHAPDLGWIPVDVMAPEFGRLDPRRVTWHYNRDLLMTPRQAGEPIEWNTTAYIEIDGETYTQFTRKLTYEGR